MVTVTVPLVLSKEVCLPPSELIQASQGRFCDYSSLRNEEIRQLFQWKRKPRFFSVTLSVLSVTIKLLSPFQGYCHAWHRLWPISISLSKEFGNSGGLTIEIYSRLNFFLSRFDVSGWNNYLYYKTWALLESSFSAHFILHGL